jgi:hypothetical protein
VATKYGTSSIGRRALLNALHAIRYAADIGRAFNTLVTINFATLGLGDDEAGAIFQELQARVSRWWGYQRDNKGRADLGRIMGVHSHANPAGSRHVHWMLHVPEWARDEFEEIVANRLCKLTQTDDLKDALHFLDVKHAGNMAKYMFKGVDPLYAEHFYMKAVNEGTVTGRRTGASRACGHAARRDAKWVRKQRPKEDLGHARPSRPSGPLLPRHPANEHRGHGGDGLAG